MPHIMQTKELIAAGAIGEPREVECISHFNLDTLKIKHKMIEDYILKDEIKKIIKPNDTIVFMGAGSISSWCNKFVQEFILLDQNNE